MSHHAPALADIRSDVSRRNRSPPSWAPGSFAYGPTLRTCPEGKPAPDRGTCSQSGMGWRQIPRRSPDTLRPHDRCPDTNRENNPMQSRMAWLAALRPLASGSRDGPSSWHNPSAPKPRDGARQGRLSCVANGESGRVRRQRNAESGAAFNAATDQARPAEARTAAPRDATRPSFTEGAATGESRYETRPRPSAVTTSDRWSCHPSDK